MLRLVNKYARYAKSVTIKAPEKGISSVRLTAIYKGNFCDDEKAMATLNQDGQTHTFHEKTEYISAQSGSWTSTMPIHVIKGTIYNVKGEEKSFELKPMESCTEVVQNIEFNLDHSRNPVEMMKGFIDESMTTLFTTILITKHAEPIFITCKST